MLIRVLTPGFFAREDTKTPVKIAAVAMLANIVLNLAFMQLWGHVGIAAAGAVSAWLNAALLGVTLRRRGQLELGERLGRRGPRIVLASVLMGAMLVAGAHGLQPWLGGTGTMRTLALAALVASGLGVFAILAQALGAAHWRELKALRHRPKDGHTEAA